MKHKQFSFETTKEVDLGDDVLEFALEVHVDLTYDPKYGADRDGQRGVMQLVNIDLDVEVLEPFKGSLKNMKDFPLIQKELYQHCREEAKDRADDFDFDRS